MHTGDICSSNGTPSLRYWSVICNGNQLLHSKYVALRSGRETNVLACRMQFSQRVSCLAPEWKDQSIDLRVIHICEKHYPEKELYFY